MALPWMKQPASEPPQPKRIDGAIPERPAPKPESLATYRIIGAWTLHEDGTYGDDVDANTQGWVELSGDRRAAVGETVKMTRSEAQVVSKRFAVNLER